MLLTPMRSSCLFVFALVGAGCAGTASPVVLLPVPEVERAAPPPAPVPVAVEVEVVRPPARPPPTPELRIAQRAAYESIGLTEWVLENGLTVLYLQRPVEGYHARLDAPTGWAGLAEADRPAFAHIGVGRWGPLSGTLAPRAREAMGDSATLEELVAAIRALLSSPPDAVAPFDAVLQASPRWETLPPEPRADLGAERLAQAFGQPESFTVVLVGALGTEWVEPLIASGLSVRRGAAPTFEAAAPMSREDRLVRASSVGFVGEWAVPGGWGDLPAVRVLDAVIAERAGPGVSAEVVLDAALGTIRLRIASGATMAEPDLRAPITVAEAEAARRLALDRATSAAGMARAVADLYALPGRYRPARRPDAVATLPAAIARTPAEQVDELLRRLLASSDTAGLGILQNSPENP